MRLALIRMRDERPDLPSAADQLREALSRTGQYIVLAEYLTTALAGCPMDPEALPPGKDAL